MAEKVKIEFDLDTGKSNKSVQQLAVQIKQLTKELKTTSVGTEEFKKLNDQLVKSRVEIKNAKKDFSQLELKFDIDTMESSNSLRGLQDTMKQLTLELETVEIGSDAFNTLTERIAHTRIQLKGVKEQMRGLDFGQILSHVGTVTGGLASGITAVTAVIGEGNEGFEEFTKTIITGMAVAQALPAVLKSVDSAQKLLNLTLEANPMFRMVAVIAAVIAGLILLYKWNSNVEKKQKELNKKQEEYNSLLRKSRSELDSLRLNVAELNGDLEEQIRLFSEITKSEYADEIKQIGDGYGITVDNLKIVNNELDSYNRNTENIISTQRELNQLNADAANLTEGERAMVLFLQKQIDRATKARLRNIESIKNRLEVNFKFEKELALETVELIANAYIKMNKTITQDTDKRVKDFKKSNEEMVKSVKDGLTDLEKARLDYSNELINREMKLSIVLKEFRLQQTEDEKGQIRNVASIRSELSDLRIKEIEREKKATIEASIAEQETLVNKLTAELDNFKKTANSISDKKVRQKLLNDAIQWENDLKREQILLQNLLTKEYKLTADEVSAIREQSSFVNTKFLKDEQIRQRQIVIEARKTFSDDRIEDLKREMDAISDEEIKALQKRLFLEQDLTIDSRTQILNEIEVLEMGHLDARTTMTEWIVEHEERIRRQATKESLKTQLMEYEGMFRQLAESAGDSFPDNFNLDLDNSLNSVEDLAVKYSEVGDIISDIMLDITTLQLIGEQRTDDENKILTILQDQRVELGSIQDQLRKHAGELENSTRLNLELEKAKNDLTTEDVQLQLQRLQLIDLQTNAMMRMSDIEIERYTGNLQRQTEATKNQINLRRNLELTELDSLYKQKLITTEQYLKSQEDIEAVYRRRRMEADIEAYEQVFAVGQELGNAAFEINNIQQQEQFDNEMKKLSDTFDAEQNSLSEAKEAGLITEETYQAELEKLEEDRIKKEKKMAYDKALSEKQQAVSRATIESAINVITSFPNPIGMALAASTGLAQVAIINAQPLPQLEKGALVRGKRHSQGGINTEIEDGEIVLNRNVSKNPMLLQVASMMNEGTGGKRLTSTSYRGMESPSMKNDQSMDIKSIVSEVVNGVASIPVNNVATDTGDVMRKVKNLEDKSKI